MNDPKEYLSKRENGTYCIIVDGISINIYMSKEDCNAVAKKFNVFLPDVVWYAKSGKFITE